jgi:ABC-type Fe3+/spermidine/putrescine transport system ATPase subunit
MDRGEIIQAGHPADVFSHPVHPTVASIAGYENVLEGTASPEHEGRTPVHIGGGVIHANGSFPEGARYLACIRAANITLASPDQAPDETTDWIEGTLRSITITDQGYRLRFDGPFPLTIEIQREVSSTPVYHPGDRVRAGIEPEHVHLISLPGEDVEGSRIHEI